MTARATTWSQLSSRKTELKTKLCFPQSVELLLEPIAEVINVVVRAQKYEISKASAKFAVGRGGSRLHVDELMEVPGVHRRLQDNDRQHAP